MVFNPTVQQIQKVRRKAEQADRDKDVNLRLALLDILIELKRSFDTGYMANLTNRQIEWMGGL